MGMPSGLWNCAKLPLLDLLFLSFSIATVPEHLQQMSRASSINLFRESRVWLWSYPEPITKDFILLFPSFTYWSCFLPVNVSPDCGNAAWLCCVFSVCSDRSILIQSFSDKSLQLRCYPISELLSTQCWAMPKGFFALVIKASIAARLNLKVSIAPSRFSCLTPLNSRCLRPLVSAVFPANDAWIGYPSLLTQRSSAHGQCSLAGIWRLQTLQYLSPFVD